MVCPTPEGNKYNAAVKWKLPAVTAEWLKACAVQSKRVDETPFLVGETIGTQIFNTSILNMYTQIFLILIPPPSS